MVKNELTVLGGESMVYVFLGTQWSVLTLLSKRYTNEIMLSKISSKSSSKETTLKHLVCNIFLLSRKSMLIIKLV